MDDLCEPMSTVRRPRKCHDPLFYGGERVRRGHKFIMEGGDPVFLRPEETGIRVLVERNDIDFARNTAREVIEVARVLQRIRDVLQKYVFKSDFVFRLLTVLAASVEQNVNGPFLVNGHSGCEPRRSPHSG